MTTTRTFRLLLAAALPAAGLAAAVAMAACDDVQQHVYTAYLFDPVNDCVSGTSTAIDVVPGEATGDTCAPVCLVASSGAVYVSPVCAPYPSSVTAEAADAATGAGDPCTAALAAYDLPDGGGICGNGATGDDGGDAGQAGDAGGADDGATTDAGDRDAGPADARND